MSTLNVTYHFKYRRPEHDPCHIEPRSSDVSGIATPGCTTYDTLYNGGYAVQRWIGVRYLYITALVTSILAMYQAFGKGRCGASRPPHLQSCSMHFLFNRISYENTIGATMSIYLSVYRCRWDQSMSAKRPQTPPRFCRAPRKSSSHQQGVSSTFRASKLLQTLH